MDKEGHGSVLEGGTMTVFHQVVDGATVFTLVCFAGRGSTHSGSVQNGVIVAGGLDGSNVDGGLERNGNVRHGECHFLLHGFEDGCLTVNDDTTAESGLLIKFPPV